MSARAAPFYLVCAHCRSCGVSLLWRPDGMGGWRTYHPQTACAELRDSGLAWPMATMPGAGSSCLN